MVLPLYTVLQWKVQHLFLVYDFRLAQTDFAPADTERGLWVSAAHTELGHDWNLGEPDSAQLQMEEHV